MNKEINTEQELKRQEEYISQLQDILFLRAGNAAERQTRFSEKRNGFGSDNLAGTRL